MLDKAIQRGVLRVFLALGLRVRSGLPHSVINKLRVSPYRKDALLVAIRSLWGNSVFGGHIANDADITLAEMVTALEDAREIKVSVVAMRKALKHVAYAYRA